MPLTRRSTLKSLSSYTWTIEHFSTCTSPTEASGPCFYLPKPSRASFGLCLAPHCSVLNFGVNFTSLCIYMHSSGRDDLTIKYHISIVNADGDKCETQECRARFVKNELKFNGQYNIARSHLLDPANRFLVNDRLSIYCEIGEIVIRAKPKASQAIPPHDIHVKIAHDYESLLESGRFADTVLVVSGKEFRAHKSILAARSPIFARMFDSDPQVQIQGESRRIRISDVTPEVFEHILRYLYCGKLEDEEGALMEHSLELLVAANKYEMHCLKSLCEQFLKCQLDIESVTQTYLLADMHQALDLKSACVDYITDHASGVMITEGWKTLTRSRVELVVDLFASITAKTNR